MWKTDVFLNKALKTDKMHLWILTKDKSNVLIEEIESAKTLCLNYYVQYRRLLNDFTLL